MALRCLIVDDNLEFLEASRDLLHRQGIVVVGVASTIAEALRRADELCPDVTLVDVYLGDESGFELARQLAGRPVVLVSSYAEQDLDELVAASTAVGFVSKADLSRRAICAALASESPGDRAVDPGCADRR